MFVLLLNFVSSHVYIDIWCVSEAGIHSSREKVNFSDSDKKMKKTFSIPKTPKANCEHIKSLIFCLQVLNSLQYGLNVYWKTFLVLILLSFTLKLCRWLTNGYKISLKCQTEKTFGITLPKSKLKSSFLLSELRECFWLGEIFSHFIECSRSWKYIGGNSNMTIHLLEGAQTFLSFPNVQ